MNVNRWKRSRRPAAPDPPGWRASPHTSAPKITIATRCTPGMACSHLLSDRHHADGARSRADDANSRILNERCARSDHPRQRHALPGGTKELKLRGSACPRLDVQRVECRSIWRTGFAPAGPAQKRYDWRRWTAACRADRGLYRSGCRNASNGSRAPHPLTWNPQAMVPPDSSPPCWWGDATSQDQRRAIPSPRVV